MYTWEITRKKMSNSQMWLKIDLNLIFGKRQREKDVKEEEILEDERRLISRRFGKQQSLFSC